MWFYRLRILLAQVRGSSSRGPMSDLLSSSSILRRLCGGALTGTGDQKAETRE